jgi:Domain of unknown function (DUF1877).
MGHDMFHQAVPAGADWWDRILASREVRADISLLAYHLVSVREGRPDPLPEPPIRTEAGRLLGERPGVELRHVKLMRWWDKLHYLLSGPRRAALHGPYNFKDAEDVGTMAVRGQRRLGQDIHGGQGYQVRYTDAEGALEVAAFLDRVTEADLRTYYAPAEMRAAYVYKMSGDEGEQDFKYLLGYFHYLRRLYAEVVEHEEGVLVCIV